MNLEDKQRNYELAENLFSEQNFAAAGIGIVVGVSMQYLGLVAVWFAVFLVKRPLSRAETLAIGMYELKG